MRRRCYRELRRLETFEERFDYLSLVGFVGNTTFGFDRWLNQHFYRSREWKQVRDQVIVRDGGCDLGIPGHEISRFAKIMVHHMNPMSIDDVVNHEEWILDPEFLITTTHRTHNAIHYGDVEQIKQVKPRQAGDTKLW